MILEFEDEKGLLDEQTRALMQTCSQAAQRAEGVTLPLSVFIRVADDDEIRAINREQRGKDAATDVLSFPTVNYPKGQRRRGVRRRCCARNMTRTRMRAPLAIS